MRRIGWLLAVTLLLSGCAAIHDWLASAPSRIEPTAAPQPCRLPSDCYEKSTGQVAQSQAEATPLPTGPKAPPITNDVWLNTEPLSQAKLDGKVVLIDFWTFG